MRDFPWGATRSFKPLHKICDFDLMFDAHIRDGHLHYTEPFLALSARRMTGATCGVSWRLQGRSLASST